MNEPITIDAGRASVLYAALDIAVEATRKQLTFKKQDSFRNDALKMMLGVYEAEKAKLAAAFPELKP